MSSFPDEDIARFSRDNGFLGWGLVSAKEGTGIDEAASRYWLNEFSPHIIINLTLACKLFARSDIVL